MQGVGFRPFVCRLATELGLDGRVGNVAGGVCIEAEGERGTLEVLVARLTADPPARAVIESLERRWLAPSGGAGFDVVASLDDGPAGALVPPDAAVCPACLAEVLDPTARRHRYPFTSCTACGPRYSIVERMPWDRAHTTMRAFPLCAACRAEYEDTDDRRFHAETLCCAACGPRLALLAPDGRCIANDDAALEAAVDALAAGRTLALKGLGGYQLVVRADDAAAVTRLRRAKHRGGKPFAVLYADLDDAARDAVVDRAAARALDSAEGPIVLLERRAGARACDAVAPGCPDLGVLLPTTALHRLLVDGVGAPLVATSGNRADEPLAIDETGALAALAGMADLFLTHDRPIARPVDDSVIRPIAGHMTVLRRARGYAPLPLPLGDTLPQGRAVLAVGAQIKGAVALAAGGRVYLGEHLGDLDAEAAVSRFERAVDELQRLYGVRADTLACDRHPDYASTRFAAARDAPLRVQHHHAHVAACMAEHDLDGRVLGLAWDGTGDGGDGTVWGGECLDAARGEARRIATLRAFPLPGGEAAVREPRRVAFGLMHALGRDGRAAGASLDDRARQNLARLVDYGINTPATTSVGRLFDAVAALLGLCEVGSYEAEAAMRLEQAARASRDPGALPLPLLTDASPWRLDWGPLVEALLDGHAAGVPVTDLARRFHNALAGGALTVAERAGLERVCLTGGCFQNRVLTEATLARLERAGFRVYTHRTVPPNDGGIALGQAVVAARRLNTTR